MYHSIITRLIVRRCIRIIGKLLSVLVLQVYYCIENFSVNIFIQFTSTLLNRLTQIHPECSHCVVVFSRRIYPKAQRFFKYECVHTCSHTLDFLFRRLSNTSKPIIMNPMIDLYYLCMDHMDVERIVLILTTL